MSEDDPDEPNEQEESRRKRVRPSESPSPGYTKNGRKIGRPRKGERKRSSKWNRKPKKRGRKPGVPSTQPRHREVRPPPEGYAPAKVGKRHKGDQAKRPATRRPPPGSQPPLDPASPTLDEIRLSEALQGKKRLTPKPKDKRRPGTNRGGRTKEQGLPAGMVPFRKGHTLQPTPEQRAQRPKPVQEVIAMFRMAAPDAFAALKDALSDPKLKVTAANSILDRGYGKPTQQVEITGKDGGPLKQINVDMSAEEAARLYADTIAAGALPGATVRQLAHDNEGGADPDDEQS